MKPCAKEIKECAHSSLFMMSSRSSVRGPVPLRSSVDPASLQCNPSARAGAYPATSHHMPGGREPGPRGRQQSLDPDVTKWPGMVRDGLEEASTSLGARTVSGGYMCIYVLAWRLEGHFWYQVHSDARAGPVSSPS